MKWYISKKKELNGDIVIPASAVVGVFVIAPLNKWVWRREEDRLTWQLCRCILGPGSEVLGYDT